MVIFLNQYILFVKIVSQNQNFFFYKYLNQKYFKVIMVIFLNQYIFCGDCVSSKTKMILWMTSTRPWVYNSKSNKQFLYYRNSIIHTIFYVFLCANFKFTCGLENKGDDYLVLLGCQNSRKNWCGMKNAIECWSGGCESFLKIFYYYFGITYIWCS